MKNRNPILYGLTFVCMGGCTHSPESAMPATICIADTARNISFSKDVIPIFHDNCLGAGCHAGTAPAGHLSLDTAVAYQQLYQPGKGYIDTATPKNSLLYSQLLSSADPMPPGGELSKCDIEIIYKWMEQGAMNN